MFVLSHQDNALFRAIATLVTIALVLWGVGMHVHSAQAANLTDVSNTLSDSAPGVVANHEIAFTIPTGSNGIDAVGEQITVTFPTGFNLSTSSVAFGDVDIEINTTDETIVDGLTPAANQWGFDITGQVLTLESGGGTAVASAGDDIVIKVGDNADGGTNQVTNHPTPDTAAYEFVIDVAGSQDTGRTRVVIVDTVLVTAQVDTSFNFTVSGFATAGIAVNGTSTTGTTTATTLPFGTLADGNIETLAQELTVATNAINGFVVTGEVDHQLLSSTGADIDAFDDATFGNPALWTTPGNDVLDENTWGHWGWTTEDATTTRGAAAEFGTNEWEGASTSPTVLFSHDGPADGTTPHIGSTTVGFQA